MKYDKTKPILGIDGAAYVERAGDPPLTFGKVVISALLSDLPDQVRGAPPTGDEKYRRFLLAQKVEKAEQFFELTMEEASLVRRLVAIFPPTYVGRSFEILDNPEPGEPKA